MARPRGLVALPDLRPAGNGEVIQDRRTDQMVCTIGTPSRESRAPSSCALGDLLATSTPTGGRCTRTPPWLVHSGDLAEVGVERLGTLRGCLHR